MLIVVTFRRCQRVLAREEAMCPRPVLPTATAFLLLTKLHELATLSAAGGGREVGEGGGR